MLSEEEREELARQHLCCNLSDAERDALNECECGHFRNEHSLDGCLATEDEPDRSLHGVCICSHSPEAVIHHAVQEIRDAAREQVLAQVEALHRVAAEQARAVKEHPAVAALVEALEHQHSAYGGVEETCTDCGYEYPCPTARALADLTAALGGDGQ